MNSIVKNTLILTIITLVSGLLLGTVYEITKGPIAVQEEKTKNAAFLSVMSDAAAFEENAFDISDEKSVLEAAGLTADDITDVIKANDSSGNLIGYIFTVVSHEGYGGDIAVTVGISADKCVSGISITSISETAGLGMRANTDEFKNQFKNKKVDHFVYSKSGASAENEIDALSGATITTNAMTNAVNSALVYFDHVKGGE